MKKNDITLSLLLNLKCNYNHFILGTYNSVFSIHLYREFDPYTKLSYPIIIKGDFKERGSKFMLKRTDLGVLMFYEVKETIITDYYSRFTYLIYKTIPKTFKYTHIVEVRYINEYQCDIRASIIYDKYILSERELQEGIKHINKVYRNKELSLRTFIARKISNIYVVINSNIELIWNILRNMKMIHKYINFFGNKINYNGEILKKDDIIEISN